MDNQASDVLFPILFPTLYVSLFAHLGARYKWGGSALAGASQQALLSGVTWGMIRVANWWLFKDPWSDWETITVSVGFFWACVGGLTRLALWVRQRPKAV
jgi:hypothetical protein